MDVNVFLEENLVKIKSELQQGFEHLKVDIRDQYKQLVETEVNEEILSVIIESTLSHLVEQLMETLNQVVQETLRFILMSL
jgi:hypothetical protein